MRLTKKVNIAYGAFHAPKAFRQNQNFEPIFQKKRIRCCYQGFYTHLRRDARGSKGVSLSTTSAVVQSCVAILVADYLVTSFLL